MLKFAACVATLLAVSAHAEVTSSSATQFVSTFRKDVQATQAQAFDAIGKLSEWWNPAHTYSGKASNMRIGMKAGDCFCEDWDNGNSVEHARVLMVMRGSLVRMDASLGPLQPLGARGILSMASGTANGKTFMQMVYRVSGAPEANLDKLAAVVDGVMAEQFARWTAFAEKQ